MLAALLGCIVLVSFCNKFTLEQAMTAQCRQ